MSTQAAVCLENLWTDRQQMGWRILDPDGARRGDMAVNCNCQRRWCRLVDNGRSPSPGFSLPCLFCLPFAAGEGQKAIHHARARAHQGPRTDTGPFWSCSRRPADEPMTERRGPGFWPAWARQFGQRRRDLVGLAAEGGERGQHEARLKGSSQREG